MSDSLLTSIYDSYSTHAAAMAPLLRLTSSMNEGDFNRRLIIGKRFEQWIRESVNKQGLCYENISLQNWKEASLKQDTKDKIDLLHNMPDGTLMLGQSKVRQADSGNDIGLALIQPYAGLFHLKQVIVDDKLFTFPKNIAARDWVSTVDLYFCLDNKLECLRVVHSDAVKDLVRIGFRQWFDSGIELSLKIREFVSPTMPGLMFKCKIDSGKGYDAGLLKIMAYVSVGELTAENCVKLKMTKPANYMYAPVQGKPII